MTALDDVAVAIEVPGIRNLAAVWLLKDGTYQVNPELVGAAARHAQQWIKIHGPHFRHYCQDLLEEEQP